MLALFVVLVVLHLATLGYLSGVSAKASRIHAQLAGLEVRLSHLMAQHDHTHHLVKRQGPPIPVDPHDVDA